MKAVEKIEHKKNRTTQIVVAVVGGLFLVTVALINSFKSSPSSPTITTVKENKNSPISRDIQTQNNYFYNADTSSNTKNNSDQEKISNQSKNSRTESDKIDPDIEISIQLKSNSNYKIIKVNGKEANILPTSTPTNPRISVKSNPLKFQSIIIILNNGDTCTLKQIFDINKLKNNIIRYIPHC